MASRSQLPAPDPRPRPHPSTARRARSGGRVRRAALGALAGAAALSMAGCTALMDMTISAQGTYDVVLEMRDTTGSTFGQNPDCSAYEDPAAMSIPQGTEVETEVLTGDGGNGCLVRIHGVRIPEASEAQEGTMVVRDGEVYRVTIPAFGQDAAQSAAGSEDGSFNSVIEARASVTFPGAVTEDGGGEVSGSTVTWRDADVLVEGVSAAGYAQDSRGVPWWKRTAGWLTAAMVLAGAGVGAAAVRRRRRGRARRTRS